MFTACLRLIVVISFFCCLHKCPSFVYSFFLFFFISVHLSFVVRGWNDETEPSVLAPELHLGWKSELRSLPRSLAGRPMTRRTQQLTGQRSRRLNSKSWLPALWLQSCKKGIKKKTAKSFTTNDSVFLTSCFDDGACEDENGSVPVVVTVDSGQVLCWIYTWIYSSYFLNALIISYIMCIYLYIIHNIIDGILKYFNLTQIQCSTWLNCKWVSLLLILCL